jgi:DNA-directed RNA polymerase specialized sigma24 family protein
MLDAHKSIQQFQGSQANQFAAWLRTILARNMAEAVRKFSRPGRDTQKEKSLQAALDHSSAWPRLPAHARETILAIVDACG